MTEHEIILTHILQCKPIDLIINKPTLSDAQQQQFEEYERRRASGEPLQYILGSWNFMGLEMKVNPSVLVPRPETEQMVNYALNSLPLVGRVREGGDIKVLDLGTGSGCIAIVIAKSCPNAKVVAVDISVDALAIAKENAQYHGVTDRIEFVQGDILASLRGVLFTTKQSIDVEISACRQAGLRSPLARDDEFDLIISNPPYIPTSQMHQLPKDVQQEPSLALDGGVDGLDFYRAIIKYTPHLLRTGGYLMMEFGDEQENAILALFDSNFKVDIFKDLGGRERFLIAQDIRR